MATDTHARSSAPGRLVVVLQLFLGMAIFGSGTPVSKLVTDAFPVFVASALRMLVAALCLLPFVLARREGRERLRTMERRDWGVVALVALVGMVAFSVLMLYGMRLVSGVVGSVVMSTTPAVTALASFLFLRDRLGPRKAAGIALAVAGVLVLNLTGSGGEGASGGSLWLGTLLVFGAVCAEAGYTLLGKVAMGRLEPLALAGLAAVLALPLFAVPAAWQWGSVDLAATGLGDWLALAWWGGGTLALGSWLWYRGVERVEGSTAAGFMGVMPVSALVLSYVLLGEAFAWVHLLGFGIVLGGVLLIAWAHAREMGEADEDEA